MRELSSQLAAENKQPRIEIFIARIRESHPQMVNIFTRGSLRYSW